MNNKKCRGSLAIKPGRTVMRGFWPLDLDLRASNRSSRDLIVAVQNESGGSDSLARGAAARVAGGDAPAAALCCRVAGDGGSSVPVHGLGHGLVKNDGHRMCNPLGSRSGTARLYAFGGDGGGGSSPRGSPASHVPAQRTGPSVWKCVQKVERVNV